MSRCRERKGVCWPTIALSFLAISAPLAQLLQGTSECLAACEHGLEQVAVLCDPLERLAHPEAARRHVLCQLVPAKAASRRARPASAAPSRPRPVAQVRDEHRRDRAVVLEQVRSVIPSSGNRTRSGLERRTDRGATQRVVPVRRCPRRRAQVDAWHARLDDIHVDRRDRDLSEQRLDRLEPSGPRSGVRAPSFPFWTCVCCELVAVARPISGSLRIDAMGIPAHRPLTQGQSPLDAARRRARAVGARSLPRLAAARARPRLPGLRGALALVGRRPRGLLGLDLGLLRGPRAHALRARARLARDAGRRVVPGRAAELSPSTCSAATRTRTPSRSSRARSRASRSSSPSASCASRSPAPARACSGSASAPATASSPTCRTSPRRSSPSSRRASLGAVWATCPPEFGVRSVLDRLGQLEPKVLLAVAGYRYGEKLVDRREQVAAIRDGPAEPRDRRPRPLRRRRGRRAARTRSRGTTLLAEPEPLEFEPLPFAHPLYVLFSSGTTGLPKAIVHGHGGILLEHLKNHGFSWDLRPGDRLLWFTTTAWMMWNALVSTLLHARVDRDDRRQPGYPDLSASGGSPRRREPTFFGLSPAFTMACRKEGLEPGRRFDLSSVRMVCEAGSPLPPEGYEWLYEQFGPDVYAERRQRRHRRLHGDRPGVPAAARLRGRDVGALPRRRRGRVRTWTASRSSASSASS